MVSHRHCRTATSVPAKRSHAIGQRGRQEAIRRMCGEGEEGTCSAAGEHQRAKAISRFLVWAGTNIGAEYVSRARSRGASITTRPWDESRSDGMFVGQ